MEGRLCILLGLLSASLHYAATPTHLPTTGTAYWLFLGQLVAEATTSTCPAT